ncbi:hypothetical protein D6C85_09626 [Aureobasidium pullulans]|uniref:F-box domain-containing protein n=1 Tax=Aureobasidium pullulans TaxID=5580 RepID=A0A4S8YT84_AURPU|nr:hypothetical protein D6D20_08212 [Aureobasidium pullulans]THZ61128.1 hypothetical protein D6C85_09626 [Aureobasidium pullulans]
MLEMQSGEMTKTYYKARKNKYNKTSAASQVLGSPELLGLVFEKLAKKRRYRSCLVNAARVNSLWFEVAISALWGGGHQTAPPVYALASVARARRQLYASNLRYLNFDGNKDATVHALNDGLSFPRLKELTLNNYGPSGDGQRCPTSQYIQRALESIKISNWNEHLDDAFLANVVQSCPNLRTVDFDHTGKRLSAKSLSDFFSATQNLTDISLNLDVNDEDLPLINADMLLHISAFNGLEKLSIENRIVEADAFDKVRSVNSWPFPALRQLRLCGGSSVISSAACLVANLRELTITLFEAEVSFISNLLAIPLLVKLEIWATADSLIKKEDFLALRSFHNLEELRFGDQSSSSWSLGGEPLTESEFAHFCSGLPLLKIFSVGMEMEIYPPMSFFPILSEHWKSLEFLDLFFMTHDLQQLAYMPAPMFPNLLWWEMISGYDQGVPQTLTAVQVGRLIDNYAPRLKELDFCEDQKKDHEIKQAWMDVRGITFRDHNPLNFLINHYRM